MSIRKADTNVLIVGAGFAGLYMLYKMKELDISAKVIEAGSDVGGTWFWNSYPGARCDVESLQYCYHFSDELHQEWQWKERYATQPEILNYIRHVADRFDLKSNIQFETKVLKASFLEGDSLWEIETDQGETLTTKFCVMATGCLSSVNFPRIKGKEKFRGSSTHTGRWPKNGLDLHGKKVGVIGTGSSAIQLIPKLAEQVEHLYVFQRTPNYTVPAQNHSMDKNLETTVKADYDGFCEKVRQTPFAIDMDFGTESALAASEERRQAVYEKGWQKGGFRFLEGFSDLFFDTRANQTAGEFIRQKIKETVHDPEVANKLLPFHGVASKRLCVDTNYYETYNRPNVTLVDVKQDSIREIVEDGILLDSENKYELDCLVYATGFDAITGALLKIDITGKNSVKLKEKWKNKPCSYLGLAMHQFPNLFTITGPGSPSVLSNMVIAIEQHVEWVACCIKYMLDKRIKEIEALAKAEEEWYQHVQEVANATVFPKTASWYTGANIPEKNVGFMPYVGGFPAYKKKCDDVENNGYSGFSLH